VKGTDQKRERNSNMIQQIFRLLINLLQKIVAFVQSFFGNNAGTVVFDNGIVHLGTKIAEGGFSYIYSAHDDRYPSKRYAVKRIQCPDNDIVQACLQEEKVHLSLGNLHPNIMPLLGFKLDNSYKQRLCYMLFPLIEGGSLRDEVTKRNLLKDDFQEKRIQQPFSERQVLYLFQQLLQGVSAVHNEGLAHCDIKLENILLGDQDVYARDEEIGGSLNLGKPILMDFGSARNLIVKLSDRRTVLKLTEEAAQNSTVSYRAPELFEGGCRHGPDEPDIDGKIDVWSCGCVLYGMMYGTSPFEMEFRQDGSIRIVDCNYLRVLGGKVPAPPAHLTVGQRYSKDLFDMVQWILKVDRNERPSLSDVVTKTELMISEGKFGISKRQFV
jgi:serine/threonine kinase 16